MHSVSAQFDATQVTLVDAGVGYREDGELWGGIVVRRKDGPTKLYAQYLPQHPNYDPPGWAAIADLTGVKADEVVHGWTDSGRDNPVAARVFTLLKEHVGKEFFLREITGVGNEQAVELIPMMTDDPGVRLDLVEGQVAEGRSSVRFTRITEVATAIDHSNLMTPAIVIKTEGAPECWIRIPDADHEIDPPEWFLIETLTAIPAVRVAYAWTSPGSQRVNVLLNRALAQLASILFPFQPDNTRAQRYAPLTPDGKVDLDALRRALVQERFHGQGVEPCVFIGRNPKDICAHAWTLLKDTIGTRLFRYNVERGASSGLPAVIRSVDGQHKLEVLDVKEKVRGILFDKLDFCRPGKGKTIGHVAPPDTVSQHMIYFADQTVPAIDTLVRIPTVRKDGTIHDAEGYDAKSRIWYAPSFRLEPIPDHPTEADVRKALGSVLHPFNQFPFVEESGSRAATIACLFDQIVRPMIDGPRPLYAFDAPALRGQGTGKSLLAKAIGAIILGQVPEVTGWPDDPKELPKTITSKLVAGVPFVIFDNLEGIVRHKDLAALATTTMWSSRLLHTNDSPRLPQTATWCTTLNGARFSRDNARRTIIVKLDAKMPEPFKRTGWKIPDLLPWVIQHRASIIRACLILVRAWVVAGRPKDHALIAGSFESWQHVVGGILKFAGLNDLPRALEEARGRDVDAHEHATFVFYWAQQRPEQLVTAAELANLAEMHGLYGAVLEKVKSPNWKGRHMAEILRKLEGHVFSGWKVERSDNRQHGQFVYYLRRWEGGDLYLVQ
jgi:hypothetical protein